MGLCGPLGKDVVGPLGVYCWDPRDNVDDKIPTRTFRTRRLARSAQASCGFVKTRIVRVLVTVKVRK